MAPGRLRIIITRPETQAVIWARQLNELGFSTVQVNLLEIRPVIAPDQIQAIKNKILNLDLYQKVIFVSQNAVQHGVGWLEDYWPQIPVGLDFFAIGATTAKKLAEYGFQVEDLAMTQGGAMTSEDILQAPGLQRVSGERILIFRGCGGRSHLGDELRARGAQVDYCELYDRILPEIAPQQLDALRATSEWGKLHNIISFHSGESLENFLVLLQRLDSSAIFPAPANIFYDTPVLVPSERIAESAKTAGFIHRIVAENATDSAMTSALLNYDRAFTALTR